MARTQWIALLVAVIVVCGGIGAAIALSGSSAGSTGHGSPQVAAILSSPQDFYGQRVRVKGSVNAVYGSHAFTFGVGTEQGLLVALKSPAAKRSAPMNAQVVVTGVVRNATARALARWTGSSSDPAGILTTFEGKPAVFATDVKRIR